MSDRQAQRHAAAMLAHNIGSSIEALRDVPPHVLLENFGSLGDSFNVLGDLLIRLGDIDIAKNEQLRAHQ